MRGAEGLDHNLEEIDGLVGDAQAVGQLVARLEGAVVHSFAEPKTEVRGDPYRSGPHLSENLDVPAEVVLAGETLTAAGPLSRRHGQGSLSGETEDVVVVTQDADPGAEVEVADDGLVVVLTHVVAFGARNGVVAHHHDVERQSEVDHQAVEETG